MGSIESSVSTKIQQCIQWYIYICIHIITYIYTHIYIYIYIIGFSKKKKPVGTGDFLCRSHDVRRIRGLLQVIFGSLPFSPSKVGQGWEYEGITVGWFFFRLRCFHHDLCWLVFLWWFYDGFLWFGSERCGVYRMWVIWDESDWQSCNDDEENAHPVNFDEIYTLLRGRVTKRGSTSRRTRVK